MDHETTSSSENTPQEDTLTANEDRERLTTIGAALTKIRGPSPEFLYHYTTPHGLTDILKECSIWASGSRYLNDSNELIQARDLATSVIDDRLRGSKGRYRTFLAGLNQSISEVVWKLPVYIASFTGLRDERDAGDSVDQWRGYTSQYSGFSIGFTSARLAKCLDELDLGQIFPCVYEGSEQAQLVRLVLDLYEDAVEADETDGCRLSVDRAAAVYSLVAPLFKHECFRNEAEWRIIARPPQQYGDVHLRATATRVIPHLKLKLAEHMKDLPVFRIVVGPSPASADSQEALHTYLRSNGASFKVDKSQVPYRAW